MSTKPYIWVLLLLGGLFPGIASAQGTYRIGALPSLNLNYEVKENWSANFKIESRQLFQQGTFNGVADKSYEYVLTDLSLIVARKAGLSGRFSGGYLFRLREGEPIHRLIQQYTISQRLPNLRLVHRVVSDQTFSGAEAAEYRLRYRLATEFPINGQSADTKEFYLKINNEYLNSLQEGKYDLEVRLVPLLGYTVAKAHKVETGLDYRVNSFLEQASQHSFWVCLNWFIVI